MTRVHAVIGRSSFTAANSFGSFEACEKACGEACGALCFCRAACRKYIIAAADPKIARPAIKTHFAAEKSVPRTSPRLPGPTNIPIPAAFPLEADSTKAPPPVWKRLFPKPIRQMPTGSGNEAAAPRATKNAPETAEIRYGFTPANFKYEFFTERQDSPEKRSLL